MKKLTLILLGLLMMGCGVRGRPMPPESPPPIGRGEPSFKRATEKIVLPKKKTTSDNQNDGDDRPDGE